ncbi:MAG: PrsW family intramembrane metalloprotease, partial [Ilumatobacteraceae bacterium]
DPVAWRWYDGTAWTVHTSAATAGPVTRKPRLPRWLSPPVLVCWVLTVILIIAIGVSDPFAVLAGLVPLVIVLPVLAWLDRVEPEPRSSRLHALLWGACVAVVVASVVNTVVAVAFGEVAAMLFSAPLVEEGAKALGIVWAVRRRELDGVTDGVVYAGWVAVGFAAIEDMTYFSVAKIDGSLLAVFVLRAVLTPFAHPLFTFWTGLAIGRAVHRGCRLWPHALWGYGLAVVCHAAWNGSLAWSQVTYEVDENVGALVLVGSFVLFFLLFLAVAITLFVARRREQHRFVRSIPALVLRYHVAPDEARIFREWKPLLRERRSLPRRRRRAFDRVHAALARLSLLHERPGAIDPSTEQVLASQLGEALRDYRRVS